MFSKRDIHVSQKQTTFGHSKMYDIILLPKFSEPDNSAIITPFL